MNTPSLLLLVRLLGPALPLARLIVPLRAERRPPARLRHADGLLFLGHADPDASLRVPGTCTRRPAAPARKAVDTMPARTIR